MKSLQQFVLLIAIGLLFSVVPHGVEAATLSLSPGTGVYTAGQTFTTRIVINTRGQAINAAEATLSFNPAQLEVVRVQKGSTFSLWAVEPSFSNVAGTINFGGGSPAGYTGSNGTVLTVTWRSKASGSANVSFRNGSILAADGRGTNVAQTLSSGSYTIATAEIQPEPEVIEYVAPANTPGVPSITSETHDADGWSRDTTARLSWTLPADVTGVRTLLDKNSGSIPTRVYEPPIDSITLEDLEEGVQYLHLQYRNENGWGRVAHFRLAVDLSAPEDFSIVRSDAYNLTSPTQELLFTLTEDISEVERYVITHNGGEPYEFIDETGSSTLVLTGLTPGQQTFVIEAFDLAGNSVAATISFAIEAFAAPRWTEYPTQVSQDVVPVFFGESVAEATVFATLTPIGRGVQSTEPITFEISADEAGVFRVVPNAALSEGVYELAAYAVDTNGSQSEMSEVIRIVVTPPGYVVLGGWVIDVLSVFIPIVALIGLLVLLIVYGMARMRRVRRYVLRETADAMSVLDEHFTELQKALDSDKKALVASRKTKRLTKAETQLIDDLQTRITETHTRVRKEISEVDDIVE